MNNCEHDIDIDTSMTKLRCVKCGKDANVIEIEKRDRLLAEANKLIKKSMMKNKDGKIEWLKQYEEMRGGK